MFSFYVTTTPFSFPRTIALSNENSTLENSHTFSAHLRAKSKRSVPCRQRGKDGIKKLLFGPFSSRYSNREKVTPEKQDNELCEYRQISVPCYLSEYSITTESETYLFIWFFHDFDLFRERTQTVGWISLMFNNE